MHGWWAVVFTQTVMGITVIAMSFNPSHFVVKAVLCVPARAVWIEGEEWCCVCWGWGIFKEVGLLMCVLGGGAILSVISPAQFTVCWNTKEKTFQRSSAQTLTRTRTFTWKAPCSLFASISTLFRKTGSKWMFWSLVQSAEKIGLGSDSQLFVEQQSPTFVNLCLFFAHNNGFQFRKKEQR